MAVNTHIWAHPPKPAGRALMNRTQANIAQYAVHLRAAPVNSASTVKKPYPFGLPSPFLRRSILLCDRSDRKLPTSTLPKHPPVREQASARTSNFADCTMPKLEIDHSRNSEPTGAATNERRGPRRWRNRVENEGRLASDAARPVDIGFQSHTSDQVEDCWGDRKRSDAKVLFLPRVEKALAYVAHLIETRPEGESYWPIFERLEHEREQLASRADRLRAAKGRI